MTKRRKSLVAQETQEFLEGQGLPAIHVLLAAVAAGYDPRKGPTTLQTMVRKLKWRMPSQEEWVAIREEIMDNPMFAHEQVGLSDSVAAMKELMKYCQPQLKSVEMDAVVENNIHVAEFSEEARADFLDTFQRHFGD